MEVPPPISAQPSPATPNTIAANRGNDKLWAVLCHLSTFLGVGLLLPLVVYLVMKDESEYVRNNAREALNFHISVLIYFVCSLLLAFLLIGFLLAPAVIITAAIFAIIAAVRTSDGEVYRYPLTIRFIK